MEPAQQIVCVECGGTCGLITARPHEGFEPGDIVAYRCPDCLERWDIELVEEDFEEPDGYR